MERGEDRDSVVRSSNLLTAGLSLPAYTSGPRASCRTSPATTRRAPFLFHVMLSVS